MSGIKRFYEDAAEAGMCPIEQKTWDYLDDLECAGKIDFLIESIDYEFLGHDGTMHVAESISVEVALWLVNHKLANDEIKNFVECFGGFWRCNDCGRHGRSHYFVDTGAEILCVDCG